MLRNKDKFFFASLPVCQFASLRANRLTILVLCFIFLSSALCAEEQYVYDVKGKRNPFIALVTPDGRLLKLDKEEGMAGLSLEGIIYDKYGLSYAIVNGEVVKISDRIGDYQVLKIEKNRIVLVKEGQLVELELKEEEGE